MAAEDRTLVRYDDLYQDDQALHDQFSGAEPIKLQQNVMAAPSPQKEESGNEQEQEQEEERWRFDPSSGLFMDSHTQMFYDFTSGLFYNLLSREQTSPCYHWDPVSAKFLPVLVDRIVRFPKAEQADTLPEEEHKQEGTSIPQQAGAPSLLTRGGDRKEEAEANNVHTSTRESDEKEEEEEGEGEDEDEKKIAMRVRTRGVQERQSWFLSSCKDWTWDATSGSYFDPQTGLYYSPGSDLYMDYNAFPAAIYHRLSQNDYVEVMLPEVPQGSFSSG